MAAVILAIGDFHFKRTDVAFSDIGSFSFSFTQQTSRIHLRQKSVFLNQCHQFFRCRNMTCYIRMTCSTISITGQLT